MHQNIIRPFDAAIGKPRATNGAADADRCQKGEFRGFHRRTGRPQDEAEINAFAEGRLKSPRKAPFPAGLLLREDDGPFLCPFPRETLGFFIGGNRFFQVLNTAAEFLRVKDRLHLRRRQKIRRINQAVAFLRDGFKLIAALFQNPDMFPNRRARHFQFSGHFFSGHKFSVRFAEILQNFVSHGRLPFSCNDFLRSYDTSTLL